MKKLLVLVFVMGMVSIASADVSTDVLANDVVATTAIVGDIVSVVLSNDTPVSFSGGLFDIVIEVQFGTHVAAIFTATSTPAVDAAGGFSGSAAVADAEDVSTPAVDAAGGFSDSAAVADAEDASIPTVDAVGGFSDSAAVADAEDASIPTVDAADGFPDNTAVADAEDASTPTVDAAGGFPDSAAA
ncbi:MAG: hypothetical protein KAT00_06465, partial [Planctomycetes bacterium]|nr:hypothetical protein [Planctomycetota bacterium]